MHTQLLFVCIDVLSNFCFKKHFTQNLLFCSFTLIFTLISGIRVHSLPKQMWKTLVPLYFELAITFYLYGFEVMAGGLLMATVMNEAEFFCICRIAPP